jgi:hypothetical protein
MNIALKASLCIVFLVALTGLARSLPTTSLQDVGESAHDQEIARPTHGRDIQSSGGIGAFSPPAPGFSRENPTGGAWHALSLANVFIALYVFIA